MKDKLKLVLGIVAAMASVIALLAIFSDFRAPSLTLKEGYEAPYGTEISVYDLVDSVHDKSDVILSLNGNGTLVSDNKAIIFSSSGVHEIEVIAEDVHGNRTSDIMKVTLRDTTPPVIQASPITVRKGDKPDYIAAATALDAVDGDVSKSLTVDDTRVNLETSGTYPITYRAQDRSGNEAIFTSQVIVTRSLAERLTLSTSTLSLTGNSYAQLKTFVLPDDWEGKVEWKSSNEKVATVSDGLVYWHGKGTCTITATADECEAECVVTCTKVEPSSVKLNKSRVKLDEGQSTVLKYTVLPSNWSGKVKWSSTNPSVATVKDGVVVWKGNGTCYVSAIADGTVYGSCEVTCVGGFTIEDFLNSITGGTGTTDDKKTDDKKTETTKTDDKKTTTTKTDDKKATTTKTDTKKTTATKTDTKKTTDTKKISSTSKKKK